MYKETANAWTACVRGESNNPAHPIHSMETTPQPMDLASGCMAGVAEGSSPGVKTRSSHVHRWAMLHDTIRSFAGHQRATSPMHQRTLQAHLDTRAGAWVDSR